MDTLLNKRDLWTDKFSLDGKVAIVTGAGNGIGRGISTIFAEAGAKVVIADISPEDGEQTAKLIQDAGGEAKAIECDVNDEKQLQRVTDKTMETFGRIDIIVNNAGVGQYNQISETTGEEFDSLFHFNVTAGFNLSRISLPYLMESKGCIVNITSAVGRIVHKNFSLYGATKAALAHLTKVMAQDLAPDVRVNAIAPGAILTPALQGFTPADVRSQIAELTPMKRLGEPEDIALAALYLVSPAASWVTGKILEVDGGLEKPGMPSE